jgi:acyl-CoA synthetase (NDP forming)
VELDEQMTVANEMELARKIIQKARQAGQKTLSEYDSKSLLSAYGIPITREHLANSLESAQEAALALGYPVALKACGESIAHKTETGLIEVGLKGPEELAAAYERMAPAVQKAGADFLVQEMIKGERELVLGMVRDAGFGPCVMLGLGGIFTEALADVAFCPAPLSGYDAEQMRAGLKSAKLLGQFRGMPEVDQKALANCLSALGRIALDHPEVSQIDLNPMIVKGADPVAVDALVVLGKADTPEAKTEPPKVGLDKFFSPKSVVVIGASATKGKSGNDVIRNIIANEYKGELYLVNPKGGEIMGHKVYQSISDLPRGIDQAIVILPAKANPQVIRDCAAQGIQTFVLAAGGFAEVDQEGEALQEELVKTIKETGVRAIGPNTSGHTSTPAGYTSSFFPLGKVPQGPISYIAQTGNFATHTMRYLKSAENFGVARVVGVGNKLDVEESEVLEYLADDPETKAIFMYLESIKRPRRFLEVASKVTRQKPVVLLKGGATPEGAGAAVAHTAALAADDRVVDGALRQAGVVRIYKYSHLFLAAKALACMPIPKGNRVSFSAPSGAMLVCMTDLCRRQLNLEIPQLSEENTKRLQDISPPYIRMRNPMDIWPAAVVSGVEFAYGKGMEIALEDANIDAVVCILMLTTDTGIPDYRFISDLARRYPEKPVYVTFSGQKEHMEKAKAFLEPRGVPTFPLIEDPFEVLDIAYRCGQAMARP